MERQIQNFDYYSKFIGETGMRFSAFTRENKIYIFAMWNGYSEFLFQKLCKNRNAQLPTFLKNWVEGIGWTWEDIPDKISETEIDWLIFNLKIIRNELDQKPEDVGYFDTNCIFDLIFFLESVKELKLELEVSDEY